MSEAVLSSSPTKTLTTWWRSFKTSNQDEPPTPVSPQRPSFWRSSASSSAVPGLSHNDHAKASEQLRGGEHGIAIPPQYADSPIFGVRLSRSLRYASVKISLTDKEGKSFVYGRVPVVVAKCAVFLKQNARDTEGIFRIPGSVRRIRVLQDLFNTPPTFGKDLDWQGFNVHDAANLLKRYLTMLPEPIIPVQRYRAFRDPLQTEFVEIRDYMDYYAISGPTSQDHAHHAHRPEPSKPSEELVNRAVSVYENLIFSLPRSSVQVLVYLLDLLSVFASQSETNKMPAYNLAAIFQPSILTIKEHEMDPDEYQISRFVLEFLIENSGAILKRVEEKAIEARSLAGAENELAPVDEDEEDDDDLDDKEPVAMTSGTIPTLNIEGVQDSTRPNQFIPTNQRRHSKSVSSAAPPAGLQESAPKLGGFLRRQRSTRSTRSTSLSEHESTPNDEPAPQPRQHNPGDEERKSRFRRSLMILLPGKDSSPTLDTPSRTTSPTSPAAKPEMRRSPSWFARLSGSGNTSRGGSPIDE